MEKGRRNGQRNIRGIGSKSKKPDLGYYFIVTDTEETEKNYIYGLRDSIPKELQQRLIIKVSKTGTSNLVDEALYRASLSPQYAELWIIFDRDEVKNFDDIIDSAEAAKINAAWSNPCIEIWFNAYFGTIPTYQTSIKCCDGFKTVFQKKTGQEYKKSDEQIYMKLCKYGDEAKAIELAAKKQSQYIKDGVKKPSQMCPATTVHELIKEIRNKIEK